MNGIAATLVIIFVCGSSMAQQIRLNGKLVTDDKRPVRNTRVGVAGKQAGLTDGNGRFSISLSGGLKEGERVIITVEKKGWVINYPLDGEWNLPNIGLQKIQTLDVVIVPLGSKALWTHARIEKEMTKLSNRIAQLQKQGNQPKHIDFSDYMRELANKYGSTPQEAKGAFDDWANAVKASADHHVKGLVDFYNQNFASAAENFKKAAVKSEENAGEEWKLAGNSASSAYNFQDAVVSYDQARKLISKTKSPDKWAEVTHLIGIAKVELGVRLEGQEGIKTLSESVAAFRESLLIKTHERQPHDWATTQNSLGNALLEQGMRAEPTESPRLMNDAVAAYRQALSVFTFEQYPEGWAGTYSNLGNALSQQGIRIEGPEGAGPLTEAVAAYRQASLVFTRERFAKQWAGIQINLGNTLKELGIRAQGKESIRLLHEAETARRQALLVFRRDDAPQEWAMATVSLATTLKELGVRTEGSEGLRLLREALATYNDATSVFSNKSTPQYWAMTQNGLGGALKELGMRVPGQEGLMLLRQAVDAYQRTLTVYSREHLPQDWAMAQDNLGRVFFILKDWTNAARCFTNFLQVYPDAKLAYDAAALLYHEILFNYEQAFALNRDWLDRHPKDISARGDFAEKYFTTSRFEQSQQLIGSLLADENLDVQIKVALRVIEIANLLALNKSGEVRGKMEILIDMVRKQSTDFRLRWSFEGTKHFISGSDRFPFSKDWLLKLIGVMAGENRDAIIDGLKATSSIFNGSTSPQKDLS